MKALRVRARSVAGPGVVAAIFAAAAGCAPPTDLPPDVGRSLGDGPAETRAPPAPAVAAAPASSVTVPPTARGGTASPSADATAAPGPPVAASAAASVEPEAAAATPVVESTAVRARVVSKSKTSPRDPLAAPQTRRGPVWQSNESEPTVGAGDPATDAWPKRDDAARVRRAGDGP